MKLLFLFFIYITSLSAETLDPIIVGSKQESKLSELTSSAQIISKEEIESINSSRVVDILNREAAVDIVQTGVIGGNASLFLRGMESRHVLILLDGVRIYDPTVADRSFNLSLLNSLDIERIEIIKGAQSVLYGSDAIAGVVNFITVKEAGKNNIEMGTGYYDQVGLRTYHKTNLGQFNFVGSWQESAIDSSAKAGEEKDLSNNKNFLLNHFFSTDKYKFETTIKMLRNFNYTDAQTGSLPIDDNESFARDTQTFFREGISYQMNFQTDIFLDLSYLEYNRYNKFLETSPSTYDFEEADGSVANVELRIKKKRNDGVLLFGVQNIVESFKNQDSNYSDLKMLDAYLLRKYLVGEQVFEIGSRYTQNEDYGGHLVYSLGYNYLINDSHTVKSGLRTGFKAPSVYHQTDPNFGNPDLGPEKSVGGDIEYSYNTSLFDISTSLFYNDVEEFIQFSNSTFNNVSNAKYWGLEVGIESRTNSRVVGASLTLTDYELSTGKEAARRPNEVFKLNYLHFFNKIHSLNFDLVYRGESFDNVTSNKVVLKSYDVWNLDYTADFTEFRIVTSLKNIFDREYETIAGYSTLGRNFQINVVSYY